MDQMHESMGAYYENKYPEDLVGCYISDNSFVDLFEALENYKDVYKVIGVTDSVVRERLFVRLAEITGVEYEDIYNQWIAA